MSFNNFKINIILILIVFFFGCFALGINAAFNEQINYQGKLTDGNDVAVTNGDYNIEFKLYATSTGGTAEWTETCTSTNKITVTSGLFSHLLGSVNSISDVDFNQTLWLGVNIGGSGASPSWDGEMTPRKKLGAVPAAFEADKLDGIDSSQFLRSDAVDTMNASSSSTLLTVQQDGSGNIVEFKDATTTVFTIADGGDVTLTGAMYQPVYGTDDGLVLYVPFSEKVGDELLTDGELENWSGAGLDSWTEQNTSANRIIASSTDEYSGTYAAKLTADGNDGIEDFNIGQGITTEAGAIYQANLWYKYSSRTQGRVRIKIYDSTAGTLAEQTVNTTTTDYFFMSVRFTAYDTSTSIYSYFDNETDGELYVDKISVKKVSDTAYDYSPYANDGTIATSTSGIGASYADGKYGQAMQFDGVDDYVSIVNSSSLNFGNNSSYSIEFWIKSEEVNPTSQEILGKHTSGNQRIHFHISSGVLHRWSALTGPTISSTKGWQHIIYTYSSSDENQGTEKFFENGDEYISRTGDMPAWDANSNYYIGSYSPSAWFFNGTIDEVKIYNRALDADEIKTHYLRGTKAHGVVQADNFRILDMDNTVNFQLDSSGNAVFTGTVTSQGTGTTTYAGALTITSTSTPQFKLAYDSSNYLTASVDSEGATTLTTTATTTFTTTDLIVNLGDSAGSNKFYIKDSTGTTTLALDSSGNLDITGAMYQPVYGTDDGLVLYVPFSEKVGDELLTDGELENWSGGGLDSWIEDNASANRIIASSTDEYSGTYAAKLTADGNDGSTDFGIYQTITTETGAVYQLNIWAKYSSKTEAGAFIRLSAYDSDGGGGVMAYQNISATSTDYSFMSMRFTAADTTTAIHAILYDETDGEAYIDKISVKKVSNTAYDYSPYANDGTIATSTSGIGASYADGKYGQAMQFDGVDDYVSIADDSSLHLQNFTISFWANAESEPSVGGIIGTTGYASNLGVGLYSNSDLLYHLWAGDSTEKKYFTSIFTLDEGVYGYYVITKSGTVTTSYKNGVFVKTSPTDITIDIDYSSVVWQIGQSIATNYNFNGTIDEVKIYNRALDADEIKTHYLRGTKAHGVVQADSFRVVDMDNVANFQLDNAGNAIFTGGVTTASVTGSDTLTFTSTATTTFTTTDLIVNLGDSAGSNKFYIKDSTGTTTLALDSSGNLDITGAMYQPVYGTDDGLVLYVPFSEKVGDELLTDGELENWSGGGLDSWTEGGDSAGVRDIASTTDKYSGTYALKFTATNNDGIEDVHIRQVMTTETGAVYQINAWVKYSSRTQGLAKLNAYDTDGAGELGLQNTTATSTDYSFVSFRFIAADTSTSIYVYLLNETNGEVYYDKISVKKVSDTAYDYSPYANDGTIATSTSGTGASYADGKYGQAMQFDGVDDYVDCGDKSQWDLAATDHTFEAWFLAPTKPTENYARIFDRFSGGSPGAGYYIGIKSDTGYIVFEERADGGDYLTINDATNYADNIWHHLVLTVDISTKSGYLYVDGAQISTDTYTGNLIEGYGILGIGGDATTYNFNGSIDEVKIYNRALSSDEIKTHYLRGTKAHGVVQADTFRVLDMDNTVNFQLDSSGNAVFTGAVTSQGTGNSYFAGNVGIGTSTPSALLDVYASSTSVALTVAQSGTGNIVEFKDATTTVFAITDGGNIILSEINNIIYVDGTKYASDGVGIQQAIDALGASGGKVILPQGTYNVTSTITITQSNITLEGVGEATKLYLTNAADVDVIQLGNASDSYSHINVLNLEIDGNDANQTAGGLQCIEFTANVTESKVEGCYIHNANLAGIRIDIASHYNKIINNYVHDNGSGGSSSGGITLLGDYNIVSGNKISENSLEGITVTGSKYSIIDGNTFISNYDAISEGGSAGGNIVISNNNIYNCTDDGIEIDFTDSAITGNVIETSGGHSIYFTGSNSVISDNVINGVGTDDDGIYISGDNNIISSNRILDSTGSRYGINLIAGGDNNQVLANEISGGGFSMEVYDGGTGNTIQQRDWFEVEANTTSTALTVQQDSSGNIVEFKDASDAVFTIADGGAMTSASTATTTLTATDLVLNLGDAAGSNKFYVKDSGGTAQLTLDSDGNLDITGAMYQPVYGTDDGLVLYVPFSEKVGSENATNTSFETWTASDYPTDWTELNEGTGRSVGATLDKYSGFLALDLLASSNDGVTDFGIYDDIVTEAGAVYQINVWLKLSSRTQGSARLAACDDSSCSSIHAYQDISTVSSDYSFVSLRFIPDDTTTYIQLLLMDETTGEVRFDDVSVKKVSNTAYDYSPYANDGTIATSTSGIGASYADGKYGQAMQFDGVDDYVDCGNNSSLHFSDSFTVEAWVKLPGTGGTDHMIIGDYNGDYKGYIFHPSAGNYMIFRVGRTSDDTTQSVQSAQSLSSGVWHHVVGRYDGTRPSVFVNGVITEGSAYSPIEAEVASTLIGKAQWHSAYLNGTIDEVKIYNRALDTDEIKTHYLRGTKAHGVVQADTFRVVDMDNVANFQVDGSGNTTFTGNLTLANNKTLYGTDASSTVRNLAILNSSNEYVFGGTTYGAYYQGYSATLQSAGGSVTLADTGRLGVGTTTPAYKLHVWGDAGFGTSTTPTLYVDAADNNVGIGTANPNASYKLDVQGNVIVSGTMFPATLATTEVTAAWIDSSMSLNLIAGATSNGIVFKTGSDERMRLNTSGNLGIGDATPGSKLTITESGGLAFGDFNDNVIDDMETVSDWVSSDSSNTATSSETSKVKVGDGSLGITTTVDASDDDTITKTISSENWSSYERIGFWIRADYTTTSTEATTTQIISLQIHDTGGTTSAHNITIQEFTKWQYQEYNLSSIASADKDVVDWIRFRIDYDCGSPSFYIDQVRLYDDNERTSEMLVDMDGNLVILGRAGVEIGRGVPGGSLPSIKAGSAIVEINQPLSVQVPGDVGMNQDLSFTGTGLSSITSQGPLTISAGDSNHYENLTLTTGNTGDVIVDIVDSKFGFKIAGWTSGGYLMKVSPSGNLDVRHNITTTGYITLSDLTAPDAPTFNSTSTSGSCAADVYYYRITAGNDNGETTASASTTATSSASNTITLSWVPVDGATKYYFYRSTDSNFAAGDTASSTEVSATSSSYTDDCSGDTNRTVPSLNGTGGRIGINIADSSPDRRLEVLDTSDPQLRLTQVDGSYYAEFKVDSAGDLRVTSESGDNIKMVDDNLWVCSGGSMGSVNCPSISLSDNGNIVAEGDIYTEGNLWLGNAFSTTTSFTSFSTSSLQTKSANITGLKGNNPTIRKIKLYISNDSGAANLNFRLSFYNSTSMTEDELIKDIYFNLVYTEIADAGGWATSTTTGTVDSTNGFLKYDLIRLLGGTQEEVRITAVDSTTTLTFTSTAHSHDVNTGVVKVAEFSDLFQLYDIDSSNQVHAKLEAFATTTNLMNVTMTIEAQ